MLLYLKQYFVTYNNTIINIAGANIAGATTIALTSNKAPVCRSDVASYRCVAMNSTLLVWEVSTPVTEVIIVFDRSGTSFIGSSKSQFDGIVWALLVEQTSSVVESILTIRSSPIISSAIITCFTSGAGDSANYTTSSKSFFPILFTL